MRTRHWHWPLQRALSTSSRWFRRDTNNLCRSSGPLPSSISTHCSWRWPLRPANPCSVAATHSEIDLAAATHPDPAAARYIDPAVVAVVVAVEAVVAVADYKKSCRSFAEPHSVGTYWPGTRQSY